MHQRLCPETSLLVIIDVQERLLPRNSSTTAGHFQCPAIARSVINPRRSYRCCRAISQGLGGTVKKLLPFIPADTAADTRRREMVAPLEVSKFATAESSENQTLQAIQKDIAAIAQMAVNAAKWFAYKCPNVWSTSIPDPDFVKVIVALPRNPCDR